MKYTYLLLDLAIISVPFLASFYPKHPFYKLWIPLLKSLFLTGLFFIIWDVAFTSVGIWGFNPEHLLGITIFQLPLEEWLFFIVVPYACTFSFFAFESLLKKSIFESSVRYLTLFIFALCVALAITQFGRHYTFFTALFTAIFLGLHLWKWKTKWMAGFYMTYAVILIPFIISNGILTGLHFYEYPLLLTNPEIVSEQVVWYNNDHNLATRLFSIPIDDFIYSLLLQLMTVTYFMHFRSKKQGSALSA